MNKWARIKNQLNIPLGENGQRITGCAGHIALSKNAAKEGMVLLKNDNGVLPLAKGTKLALFGKGTFDYVKGGGGSGDVTVAYTVNLYEGLKSLGNHVLVEETLADFYREYVLSQYELGREPGMIPEPDLPDELCEKARVYTDTAVISISRFSGEGWDRGGKGQELFEKGDFYLSKAENAMVKKVKTYFPKTIVVLNVGGIVDTDWFHADDQIQSVLLAWQGGMVGGQAAAEILCGLDNPSGKLADTFAKRLEDYPSTLGFHESDAYVDYFDDIYVGYRYFETIPGARERVNYPFGYGLSYTEFDWKVESTTEKNGKVKICVRVCNVGSAAGKEVIQAYISAPQGVLGKPAKTLMAFQKTELLQPGADQILTLEFNVDSMASYDDLGKVVKSAWVLEKGDYFIHIGTSVWDTVQVDYVYSVASNQVVEQLSSKLVPALLTRRLLADGTYETIQTGKSAVLAAANVDTEQRSRGKEKAKKRHGVHKEKLDFEHVAQGEMGLDEFVAELSDEELAHLLGNQPNTGVANTWGFGNIQQYNVPNAMTADGPAGLRIKPEWGIHTTAFPCATLLACTWNTRITYEIGVAGAKEVKENNIAVWLTPAVNIHRSPLCGRNFEYYSEDPLLAGLMAASMVRGIQSQRVAASVKHFALNNKETNRTNSDSRISERAAREIYLKVFEIIVKSAKPWYVMSSYNLINGCRASENRELLVDILRDEWGFDGMVSTDWWTHGEHFKEVKAGCDLKMENAYPDRLVAALEAGRLTRAEMEICAKRVLELILKFE